MVQSAPSYNIATHAELGEAGGLCQVRLGHGVYCCKVRTLFVGRADQSLMASVWLLAPQQGAATVPVARMRHCGGLDQSCSCERLTRTPARGPLTVALPQAAGPGLRAISNTAPKSHD